VLFSLVVVNIAVWCAALITFSGSAVLIGTALLAYGLGLRHAVDADHIAAIDNVTRKLMHEGRAPSATGLFFSLGHSTVVLLAAVAVALGARALLRDGSSAEVVRGLGTAVSAAFLLAIGAVNLVILRTVYRAFDELRRTGTVVGAPGAFNGKILARMARPLFALVKSSAHMYPLGFLFGLGFDTATEIGVLAIAATEATKGLSTWSVLIFPGLFAAGMALVDTADTLVMVRVYGWALTHPARKLFYNFSITLASVVVALAIGGIEALGLAQARGRWTGAFWRAIVALNGNLGSLGYIVIALFAASWIGSILVYRAKGYHRLA